MIMLLPYKETVQDTIPVKNIQLRDSVRLKPDSASVFNIPAGTDSIPPTLIRRKTVLPVIEITDTVSVCKRNSIEDVTFYDTNNLITKLYSSHTDLFPFLFTQKGRKIRQSEKAILVKHLRPGDEIPEKPIHGDWILVIILLATLFFGIIRKSSDNVLHSIEKFFLFRGVSDPCRKGYRRNIHSGIHN